MKDWSCNYFAILLPGHQICKEAEGSTHLEGSYAATHLSVCVSVRKSIVLLAHGTAAHSSIQMQEKPPSILQRWRAYCCLAPILGASSRQFRAANVSSFQLLQFKISVHISLADSDSVVNTI